MPEALLLPASGQVPDLASCVRQIAAWRHENGGDQQMFATSPQVYLLCLSISPSRARCEGLRLAPPFSPAMRGLWFGEPPRPEPLALGHTLQPDVCSTVSHDPVMNVHVRKDRPSSSALLLSMASYLIWESHRGGDDQVIVDLATTRTSLLAPQIWSFRPCNCCRSRTGLRLR